MIVHPCLVTRDPQANLLPRKLSEKNGNMAIVFSGQISDLPHGDEV